MASFPNQRTVRIHKPKYEGNFVQVDIDEWQEAFATLTRSGFGLYLYCCGNQDGYKLELSSAAVQNALHISDSSYPARSKNCLKKATSSRTPTPNTTSTLRRSRRHTCQSPRRKKPATAARRHLLFKKLLRQNLSKNPQGHLILPLPL